MELSYSYYHVDNVTYLNPTVRKWKIRVKILSLWTPPRHTRIKMYYMILADEKGNRIDATLPPYVYKNIDTRDLKEGNWYYLSDFQVIEPPKKIRNSGHRYQIKGFQITAMETIYPVSSSNFLELASFDSIINRSLNMETCHDAFGLVVQVGRIENIPPWLNRDEFFPQSRMIRFQLSDSSGNKVNCSAVGDCCDEMLHALRNEEYDAGFVYNEGLWPVFCLLRFWRINDCGGQPGLISQYGCSRVFINPDFPELDRLSFKIDYNAIVVPNELGEVFDA